MKSYKSYLEIFDRYEICTIQLLSGQGQVMRSRYQQSQHCVQTLHPVVGGVHVEQVQAHFTQHLKVYKLVCIFSAPSKVKCTITV